MIRFANYGVLYSSGNHKFFGLTLLSLVHQELIYSTYVTAKLFRIIIVCSKTSSHIAAASTSVFFLIT